MISPKNPHIADAAAASKWVRSWIFPRKKWDFGASPGMIYLMARWAGHWGLLALVHQYKKEADEIL